MKVMLKRDDGRVMPYPEDEPTARDLQLFDVVQEMPADGSGKGKMFLVVLRNWSQGNLIIQQASFNDNAGRLALLQLYGYIPSPFEKRKPKKKKKHGKKKKK